MPRLDPTGHLESTGIIRALAGVMVAEGWTDRRSSRVLSPQGRYHQIPRQAVEFLNDLDKCLLGMAVAEVRARYPDVVIEKLVEFRLVDSIPPDGLRPRVGLVRELWLTNLRSRVDLRRRGWEAMAERLLSGASPEPTSSRPVLFDEIETAARISFGIPGTVRKCTVVALTIDTVLRARRIPSRIEIVTTPEQVLFHSYVRSAGHIVDPGDTLVEGLQMKPVRRL